MQNFNKLRLCGFKNGMMNSVNFHYSTQKSEKLYIDWLFLSKAYNVSARKFKKNFVPWHWRVKINLNKKLTCALKNAIRNFVNFQASIQKFESFYFDGLLLSKAYKYLDEKYARIMSHDTEEWCKVWRKNWLLISKMTWGIKWILMRAVASLKIFTLMCYFCQ